MRQLLPVSVPEVSVAAVYGDIPARAAKVVHAGAGPYLALNMVSSADGAISVDGVSGGLSGSADKDVFFYLRSLADVILVGAATAPRRELRPAQALAGAGGPAGSSRSGTAAAHCRHHQFRADGLVGPAL